MPGAPGERVPGEHGATGEHGAPAARGPSAGWGSPNAGGTPKAQARVRDRAETASAVRRIAERRARGASPAEAIAAEGGPEWRVLAVAWSLAEESGGALAPALTRIAAALHALAAIRERRRVLLAAPRATVRLLSVLPLLALAFGWLTGLDPLPVLLGPAGALLLPGGGLLLLLGIAWSGAMRRRLERADHVAGLELELLWIALGGGAHPDDATRRVVAQADRFGAEWVPFEAFTRRGPLRSVVGAAERTGTPLGPLLVAEAGALRGRAQAELEREAERLGVRVLLPMGLCVLPAFILLGVVPVVLAMLGTT